MDHTFWFIHSSASGHWGHFHLFEEHCLYKCMNISKVSIFSLLGFTAGIESVYFSFYSLTAL